MKISVQTEDFDVQKEYAELKANPHAGAVVMFVGNVRDINEGCTIEKMSLEHYPGMTEKFLTKIVKEAQERWHIQDATVIHRVGDLEINDQIVFVGVSGGHRGECFDACEFIIDYLKTEAPFWKKETIDGKGKWVDARESDDEAMSKWNLCK